MKRLTFIHARVSEEESKLLNLISIQKGANISETIRYLIRSEIERNGLVSDTSKIISSDPNFILLDKTTANIWS